MRVPLYCFLKIMGRLMGIEPTSVGATIRCVNHFATAAIIILAGVVGIEPTSKVLETFVLPLNYTPISMVEGGRFELPNPKERIYSPPRLATSLPLHINIKKWCRREDLNPQPTDYKSVALPIELHRLIKLKGGSGRNRTADTRIFSPLLYRLSY